MNEQRLEAGYISWVRELWEEGEKHCGTVCTVAGAGTGHDRAGPFLVYSLWFLDNAKVVTRCGLKALPGILSLSFFFHLSFAISFLCPTLVRNCDYTLWLISLRINKWYSKISKLINGHANSVCNGNSSRNWARKMLRHFHCNFLQQF